jgi:hypothetical protein
MMNLDFKPVDEEQVAKADKAEPNEQKTQTTDDGAWRGRYESEKAEKERLKLVAENGAFAASKLLEVQDKLKELDSEDYKAYREAKNKPVEVSFFSDDEKTELEDIYGEAGAKRYMADMERMHKATLSNKSTDKQLGEVKDAAANAEYLSLIPADIRAKVINPNSELMKFAATIEVGYSSNAQEEITKMLSKRDSSEKALKYMEAIKSQFEASKNVGQAPAAPKGTSPSKPQATTTPKAEFKKPVFKPT